MYFYNLGIRHNKTNNNQFFLKISLGLGVEFRKTNPPNIKWAKRGVASRELSKKILFGTCFIVPKEDFY